VRPAEPARTDAPHLGHFTIMPAYSSFSEKVFVHSQTTITDMNGSD
jgi:hypothetical protein